MLACEERMDMGRQMMKVSEGYQRENGEGRGRWISLVGKRGRDCLGGSGRG